VPVKGSRGDVDDEAVRATESMAPEESARHGTELTGDGPGTPPVTVVLPTRDEQAHLRDCLSSLLAQDYAGDLEILVVDGRSRDATRSIARAAGVSVLDNPGITAASAMNRGIAAAGADLIVRADAHTLYEPDYVRRCVDLLSTGTYAVVGGPMRPVGVSRFGRAVAAVTSSALGVGPGRFHYARERCEVDTVFLGAFHRGVVESVGGYDDETLQWAAEDHELNFRIRRSGGRIVVDPAIRSWYFPRETPTGLARQYFNYGRGKVSTLVKHGTLPHWRPLVPAGLVAGSFLALLAGLVTDRPAVAVTPLVVYAAGSAVAAARLSDDPGVAPHRAVAALAICHWAYGAGIWAGVARAVRGRPFDARPRGARV
jgi:cellulose synthase/poly-beta-1,6-N-acetylglucosamine synthase-like glycosyltransferase